MPVDGYKDRIYYVDQETEEDREKRQAKEATQQEADLKKSGYGEMGRYWPGMEKIWEKKEAEERRKQIKAV